MKKLHVLCLILLGFPLAGWAAQSLKESTFTQIIKEVKVVSRANQSATPAKVSDVFKAPDLIRTGPESLAELIASDKTITRVGANTVFSFEPAGRAMNLEQGSVLFHSPKGQGGGTIRSKGASAAVLGTTLVVTATEGGGFKAIVLEGKGQITLPNGDFRVITAGQITFVLPGARTFGPTLNINLGKLVENSRLVQGFEKELPSKPVIQIEIERQNTLIKTGQAEDTKKLVVSSSTKETVETVESTVLEQVAKAVADPTAIARAKDVTISSSALSDYPGQLFLNRISLNVPGLGPEVFAGLIGKNITIATSQIDFTPFLNLTEFKLIADSFLKIQAPPRTPSSAAMNTLSLFANLSENVTPLLKRVELIGAAGLNIESGSTIGAENIGDVSFESGAAMSLNNVSFYNYTGNLEFDARSSLDLTGGSIYANSLLVKGGAVNLLNGSYCALNGSAVFNAYGTDLIARGSSISGNTISFEANGSVNLDNLTATATSYLNFNAQQDLNLTGGSYSITREQISTTLSAGRDVALSGSCISGFSTLNVNAVRNLDIANGSLTGGTVNSASANLTAAETISLNGPVLSGIANISMSARTLNLQNINFPAGSTVNLYSQLGRLAPNPNSGAGSLPGFVNFIINVTYNNSDPLSYVGSTINIATRR
ncbi:MAG: hypothetical protein EBS84_04605 [Proteobacteria bacterium]|nr:hypothetical protein [Verrucomicrobiota bacterium]NBU08286.1 hypothetical protein [Pseudomonadota bacterium]